MKIRNINEKHGDPVEFKGESLHACKLEMEMAILDCGYRSRTANDLVEGVDFEIVCDHEWKNIDTDPAEAGSGRVKVECRKCGITGWQRSAWCQRNGVHGFWSIGEVEID
jgi:hypothetical protein